MLLNFKKRIFIIAVLAGLVSLGLFLKFFSFEKRDKINVILIVVDALRADHLGCYGYKRDTSPSIDQLAKEGVLFTQAFSHGSATRIAVPSILTSLYPSVHRVLNLGASLTDEFITLPEILKNHGYLTAAFVGRQVTSFSNFSHRFDAYQLLESKNVSRPGQSFLVRQKAMEWLKQKPSGPFFLFLHFNATHAPYDPPLDYKGLFWDGPVDPEIKQLVEFSTGIKDKGRHKRYIEKLASSNGVNYSISQYDAAARCIDDQIKILLEYLEKSGISKDTLIIFTSDHGQEFFERGDYFHERTLFDELIHVPLIMKFPKDFSGRRIRNLVRQIDIMPTVLDRLNIRVNNIMQGKSLLPLAEGRKYSAPDSFSETFFLKKLRLKGVRTEKFKFIETFNLTESVYSYELYDLESDPKEQMNIFDYNAREANLFKAKLKRYNLSSEKIRRKILGKNFTDYPPIFLNEKTKNKLKSLGYVQ